MKKHCIVFFTFVLAFALVDLPSTYAQDEFTLEEITVTAQKREQELQDTAGSISVVPGSEIREIGAVDFYDIMKSVTNLRLSESGAGGPRLGIRGIAQDLIPGIQQPSVDMNIDGASQGSHITEFGSFDIERIEVLRGPQGTLYGRNATAGVINIVTVQPKIGVTEGYATLELGDFQKRQVSTALNFPLTDNIASRLGVIYNRQDSYYAFTDGFRYRQEGWGARMQFRYEPSDEVYVNFRTAYTTRRGIVGGQSGKISIADWNAGNYVISQMNHAATQIDNTIRETLKVDADAGFTVGPGIVTLLASTDYSKSEGANLSVNRITAEIDWSYEVLMPTGLPQRESTSFEARYSSNPDSKVIWTGGVYYSRDTSPAKNVTYATGMTRIGTEREYDYRALFGQITYPLSDTFRLVAGLRREQDEQTATTFSTPERVLVQEFNYFDWKLGVEKDFREDVMGYGYIATGHRDGGTDMWGNPFDMESNISGEVGVKSQWLNSRLQLNADIYYYDYNDYQVTDNYSDPVDPTRFLVRFDNCEKVQIYGSEIDVNWLLTDTTQWTASIAYLSATYKGDHWIHITRMITSELINANGSDMPNSPDLTVFTTLNHRFDLSSGAYLTPRVSAKYTGGAYVAMLPTPVCWQDAHTEVDLSLNFQSTYNWSLNFYGTNIFDEKYSVGMPGDRASYFPGHPRMVGCTFEVRF